MLVTIDVLEENNETFLKISKYVPLRKQGTGLEWHEGGNDDRIFIFRWTLL